MAKTTIELPSILSKDCWFYEGNEKLIDSHLGKFIFLILQFLLGKTIEVILLSRNWQVLNYLTLFTELLNLGRTSVEHGEVQPNNYGFTEKKISI